MKIRQKYLYSDKIEDANELLAEANKDGWVAKTPISCSWMPDINHHTGIIMYYFPKFTQIVEKEWENG